MVPCRSNRYLKELTKEGYEWCLIQTPGDIDRIEISKNGIKLEYMAPMQITAHDDRLYYFLRHMVNDLDNKILHEKMVKEKDMTNQKKKDRVVRLAEEFAVRRGYYLNYDSTINHDQSIRSTCFRFSHNGRGPEVVEVVWDEVDDIWCVFAKLRDYVDGCFKPTNATTFLDPATKTLLDRLGAKPKSVIPPIEKVVFNDPATIVFWADKTKTIVKCGPNDIYDPEKGLAMAIAKKALGNQGNYYNEIKKWLPEEEPTDTGIRIDPLAFAKMGDAIVEGFKRGLDRYFDRTRPNCPRPIGKVKEVELTDEGLKATVELDPDRPKPYYLWYHGPDSVAWHKRPHPYKSKSSAKRYAVKHFPEDWSWMVTLDDPWYKEKTEPEDYTWEYLKGEKK